MKEKKPKIQKPKEKKLLGKKKIMIILAVVLSVVLAVGVVLFLKLKAGNSFTENGGNRYSGSGFASNGSAEGMVSAYGVINVGTVEETLDVTNMTNNLTIAEVLVSSNDTVAAGDPLVRFTEDSVAAALEELEKNVREKELAYRSGAIEYEQSLITAKYNYDSTILKGEQADAVYNETVADMKASLESSTKSYNESVALLAEYKDAQATDKYYTEYQVEYYKNLYDENYALLQAKMTEWNVPWTDVMRGGARIGDDLESQYRYVCQQLYSVLETNLKDYENAKTKYEDAMSELSYKLLELQLNMSSIEESYLNAKKNYETSLLNAEQTRQTAKTNAELAESQYEANVEKAKTDFDTLKSAYEDAQSDYDTFVSCIVNNEYLATNDGTVMRVNLRTNGSVSANGRILSYFKDDDVTVSVSVDQTDIAKLAVGDTAICYSENDGLLSGTIISISPVTQSESISSVSYSVTVRVDSTENMPSSNTTVTVIFGMDMDSASGLDMSGFTSGNGADGMPDMSNFDFSNMPDMSNFDFSNMPNMGGSRP